MTIRERLKKSGARVRLSSLPGSIRGFVYHDDELTPYIIINADLEHRQQVDALRHELEHIENEEMYDPNYREYDI